MMYSFDDNGEIDEVQEVEQIIKIQKRHFKKGAFFMTSFEFIDIALKNNYSPVTTKVLLSLLQRLDFNNRIKGFKQSDIATQINSTQPNVSKAIKQLADDGIIKLDGVDWYFNDDFIKGAGDK